MTDKILIVLDLDETLVFARQGAPFRDVKLDAFFEGIYDPVFIYFRPGLKDFLIELTKHFRICVWSAGTPEYVDCVVENIFRDLPFKPEFVFDYRHCIKSYKHYIHEESSFEFNCQPEIFKHLYKVSRKTKLPLSKILIIDDTPRNSIKNYSNAIPISNFTGNQDDNALEKLMNFLLTLKNVENVRTIEKRFWEK